MSKSIFVERRWLIVAVLLLLAAFIFWSQNNANVAFVLATLGVVAWFLNQRDTLKAVRDGEVSTRSVHKQNDVEADEQSRGE